jgi:multisubunit Na+/H+ antiporter MnhB subunit
MTSMILGTAARLVLRVLMVFAIYLLLRGHNAPGGGFIAGLMTAAALLLMYVAWDAAYVRESVRVNYRVVLSFGLLMCGASGLFALTYGIVFMEHRMWDVHVPVLGELALGTAPWFDFGVYCGVVGVTLMIMSILGEKK